MFNTYQFTELPNLVIGIINNIFIYIILIYFFVNFPLNENTLNLKSSLICQTNLPI